MKSGTDIAESGRSQWPAIKVVEGDMGNEVGRLERELEQARETNNRLNRRCQAYEAGLAEKIKEGTLGGLGRMLANAAASMYLAKLKQAEAQMEAFIVVVREEHDWHAQCETIDDNGHIPHERQEWRPADCDICWALAIYDAMRQPTSKD